MIAAGSLRHYVILQQPTETRDEFGDSRLTWSTVARVWASIEPISGRERQYAEQQLADLSHRIRMRYRSDVTSRWRVLYGSRVFEIGSVLNVDEQSAELALTAKEVV